MDPLNQLHPLVTQGKLQLVAWRVSGEGTYLATGVSQETADLLFAGWSQGTTRPMNQAGSAGFAGVVQGNFKRAPFFSRFYCHNW